MSIAPEHIVDLFDEFYLLPDDTATSKPVEITATPPVVEAKVEEVTPEPVVVQPQEELEIKEPEVIPPIAYAGANKKHIVFIYNDKINDSRENVEMITNLIRNALKITMDDVAVIRLSKNPQFKVENLLSELTPKQVVFFGYSEFMPGAGLHQMVTTGNTKILPAKYVHEYHGDTKLKGELWAGIQKIFS